MALANLDIIQQELGLLLGEVTNRLHTMQEQITYAQNDTQAVNTKMLKMLDACEKYGIKPERLGGSYFDAITAYIHAREAEAKAMQEKEWELQLAMTQVLHGIDTRYVPGSVYVQEGAERLRKCLYARPKANS